MKMVLDLVEGLGSDVKAYREFEVPRSTFYRWKKAHSEQGEAGLKKRVGAIFSHNPVRFLPLSTDVTLFAAIAQSIQATGCNCSRRQNSTSSA